MSILSCQKCNLVWSPNEGTFIAPLVGQPCPLCEARSRLSASQATVVRLEGEVAGLMDACDQERKNRFDAAKEWRAEVARLQGMVEGARAALLYVGGDGSECPTCGTTSGDCDDIDGSDGSDVCSGRVARLALAALAAGSPGVASTEFDVAVVVNGCPVSVRATVGERLLSIVAPAIAAAGQSAAPDERWELRDSDGALFTGDDRIVKPFPPGTRLWLNLGVGGCCVPGSPGAAPELGPACNYGVVGCVFYHACPPEMATHHIPLPPTLPMDGPPKPRCMACHAQHGTAPCNPGCPCYDADVPDILASPTVDGTPKASCGHTSMDRRINVTNQQLRTWLGLPLDGAFRIRLGLPLGSPVEVEPDESATGEPSAANDLCECCERELPDKPLTECPHCGVKFGAGFGLDVSSALPMDGPCNCEVFTQDDRGCPKHGGEMWASRGANPAGGTPETTKED